jgi:hypothetical protein
MSPRRQSGGRPGSLLFQRDGDRRVCRQAHRLPFDIRDQPKIDEMMVTFVAPFAAVSLDQLDPAMLDAIDGSEMNTVRADHIHMLLYAPAAHLVSPRCRRHEGCGRKIRASIRELVALTRQQLGLRLLFGDASRGPRLKVCGRSGGFKAGRVRNRRMLADVPAPSPRHAVAAVDALTRVPALPALRCKMTPVEIAPGRQGVGKHAFQCEACG